MRLWRPGVGCAQAITLILLAAGLQAQELRVVAGNSDIVFNTYAGTPSRWTLCAPACADPDAQRSELLGADGYFRITTPTGPGGVFEARMTETATAVVVEFSAALEVYRYRIARDGGLIHLELPPMASVQFASGSGFAPEPMSGFGGLYTSVVPVQVSAAGQVRYSDTEPPQVSVAADSGTWTGIRSRYWAALLRPEGQALRASVGSLLPDRPVVTLSGGAADQPVEFALYAGPIEHQTLQAAAPELSELLFGALWEPLRWLCFGLMALLKLIYGVVGNYGVAIVLLSLTVKVLMTPLTMLADRWQAEVNRIQSRLQPELDEVRRSYRGEEAHERTLAVYRKHGVSPFYTFRSLAGFLVQIPVFIAAFDMLGENFALSEVSFLWIENLARPDHVLALPVVLPFFGGWLNLLPFLMTGLSVLAAALQREESLSPALQRAQSRRLFLMAAAFFVLFYTFPAGMVLYWTASNLFHLLKVEGARLLYR